MTMSIIGKIKSWGAALTERLKGWRTIIWAYFLMAVGGFFGLVVPLLDALDVAQIGALVPAKLVTFSPLILVLVGQITKYLRNVTTGPVGSKGDEAPTTETKAGD
jgi:membrane protein implicated in regulation of membrane protease activity